MSLRDTMLARNPEEEFLGTMDQEPKRREKEPIHVNVLLMGCQLILLFLQLLLSKWPWGDGIFLTVVADLCILSTFVFLFGERFHSTFWKVETAAETFVKDVSDWSDFLKQSTFSFLAGFYTDSTECVQRVRQLDVVVPELGLHFPGEVMVNALLPLQEKHKQELMVLRHPVDLREADVKRKSRSDSVKSFPIQLNAQQLCHKEAIDRVAVSLQCQNHVETQHWASGAGGAAVRSILPRFMRSMVPNSISSHESDSFLTLSNSDKNTTEQLEEWKREVEKWRGDWSPTQMGRLQKHLQPVLQKYLEMAGSLDQDPKALSPKSRCVKVTWTMPETWKTRIWQWMDRRAAEAPKIFFTLLPLNEDISAPFAQRSKAQKFELSPRNSETKFQDEIRLPNQLSDFSSGRLLIWLQYSAQESCTTKCLFARTWVETCGTCGSPQVGKTVVQELLGVTEIFHQSAGGDVKIVQIVNPSGYVKDHLSLWRSCFSSHMGGRSWMRGLFLRLLRGQLSLDQDSVGVSIEFTPVEIPQRKEEEEAITVLKECLDGMESLKSRLNYAVDYFPTFSTLYQIPLDDESFEKLISRKEILRRLAMVRKADPDAEDLERLSQLLRQERFRKGLSDPGKLEKALSQLQKVEEFTKNRLVERWIGHEKAHTIEVPTFETEARLHLKRLLKQHPDKDLFKVYKIQVAAPSIAECVRRLNKTAQLKTAQLFLTVLYSEETLAYIARRLPRERCSTYIEQNKLSGEDVVLHVVVPQKGEKLKLALWSRYLGQNGVLKEELLGVSETFEPEQQPTQKVKVSNPLPRISWWCQVWTWTGCDAEGGGDLEVKCEECQESDEKLRQFKRIIQKLPLEPQRDHWIDALDADDFSTLRKLYGMDGPPAEEAKNKGIDEMIPNQVERWVASKCRIEENTFETTLLRVLEPLRQQVVLGLAKPVLHCIMVSADLRGADATDAKDPIPRCMVCATIHEPDPKDPKVPPDLKFDIGQIWFEGQVIQVEIQLSASDSIDSIHQVFGLKDVEIQRKWLPKEKSAVCDFHFQQALCILWKGEGSEFEKLQRYTSKDEPKVIELAMSDQNVDLWMSVLGKEQSWWANQRYHRPTLTVVTLCVLLFLMLGLLYMFVDCYGLHHFHDWEQTLDTFTNYTREGIKSIRTGF